jgi:quercetin dioxygenase-like cupin family protein
VELAVNIDDNFRRIGSANIEEMKALVSQFSADEWDKTDVRQQRYEAHTDTQVIPLVYDDDFRHTEPTRQPALKIFERAIRPSLAVIVDFYDQSPRGKELTEKFGLGYFVRANLVRLTPGGTIAEHRDKGFSLTHAHRVHVPVITNDQVRFTVGNEALNIPEGEIYEINNRRVHSVQNNGTESRVHLVLDYVLKGEMCCCGEKRHAEEPCTPKTCIDTDEDRIPCTCLPENL